jgi:hypothetical protein
VYLEKRGYEALTDPKKPNDIDHRNAKKPLSCFSYEQEIEEAGPVAQQG